MIRLIKSIKINRLRHFLITLKPPKHNLRVHDTHLHREMHYHPAGNHHFLLCRPGFSRCLKMLKHNYDAEVSHHMGQATAAPMRFGEFKAEGLHNRFALPVTEACAGAFSGPLYLSSFCSSSPHKPYALKAAAKMDARTFSSLKVDARTTCKADRPTWSLHTSSVICLCIYEMKSRFLIQ